MGTYILGIQHILKSYNLVHPKITHQLGRWLKKIAAAATTTSFATKSTTTGVYGFNQLNTPKGFQRMADDATKRCDALFNYIATMPTSTEIVGAMDEIWETVRTVITVSALCEETHPSSKFVKEAKKASIKIEEYIKNKLATNHSTLYSALKRAEQDAHLLSNEAHRAFQLFFQDARINLPCDKLDRAKQLELACSQLCQKYKDSIRTYPGDVDAFSAISYFKYYLFEPIQRFMSRISSGSLRSQNDIKEREIQIACDLQSDDTEIRKKAYIQQNSGPRANVEILRKLLAARHELAQEMGYRSYAEYAGSSPNVVMPLLHQVSGMVRRKADAEIEAVRKFKRKTCGKRCDNLEPWDAAYYRSMMLESLEPLSDPAIVESYFPLPQCIKGLNVLVNSLFGASIRDVPMEPGESWHKDVRKVALHHPEEGDTGYLYLDLLYRPGKFPSCCQVTIKGGRRISETEYQPPVSAILCDFLGESTSTAKLDWEDLQSLFHEFGHALHSLLSRTNYHCLSGPVGAGFSFVETPSKLFEYYARDYRVLKTFAKQCSTGKKISEKLVKSMHSARDMFAATHLQRQIFLASISQTLHGEQLPASPHEMSSIISDLEEQYTSWKHIEGTHLEAGVEHLLDYSSNYYSYLYGDCLAATIWKKICEKDPLSLATGTALGKLLQQGGVKDPFELLKEVVGERVVKECNGGIVPDMTCLFDESTWKMRNNNSATCSKRSTRRKKRSKSVGKVRIKG